MIKIIYKFTLPYPNSNIFRCDVYTNEIFTYHREVHMYNKDTSVERNVLILARKMGLTLDLPQEKLYLPIRIALTIGEGVYIVTE